MKIIHLLFLLSFLSCAAGPIHYDLETVDVNDPDSKNLEIDEKQNNGYGPNIDIDGENEESKKRSRQPVIGLIHFSTLYHSQSLLTELKTLENSNVKISVIAASGYGGLIAALYAKERSVSYVEWKLFALTKELTQVKIYSENWKNILSNFIKNEFKAVKANQLKVQLIIPEAENAEIVYNGQAKVAETLIRSLNIESKRNFIRQPFNYEPSLKRDYSLDIVLKTAYLPVTPRITQLSSLQYGLYTSYLGKIIKKPEQFGLIMAPVAQEIDEIGLQVDLDDLYKDLIDERARKLFEELNSWREENDQSLNPL